jgi:hypothetical protein
MLISLAMPVILSACGQQAKESTDQISTASELAESRVTQAQLAATPQNDLYSDGKTKLIKTANYRFEVENVKKSTDAITQAIRKYPAYISSSSLLLENPILENKITIRVQNEYFYALLLEIDAQAKFVNHRNVATDDVSKDFVDLESRLKTKREVEARYMEILRKKAGTIEELLRAEEQIGTLHEEIEATISRINYLREQVSYSTINLEFYQTVTQELKASNEPTVSDKFMDALSSGWQGVMVITIALIHIWPLIVLGAGVLGFLRWKRRANSALRV